jgi:hypothetical protein
MEREASSIWSDKVSKNGSELQQGVLPTANKGRHY